MARTRAQEHPDAPKPNYASEGSKPQGHITTTAGDHQKTTERKEKKRKVEDMEKASREKAEDQQAPATRSLDRPPST